MLLSCVTIKAHAANEVDDFISQVAVRTYDCPEAELNPGIQRWLDSSDISQSQRYALTVHKVHWQICMGQHGEAREMLETLLNAEDFDRTTSAYASATYQMAFVYDVLEDDARCQYYAEAEDLARGRFSDVFLSAQMGQITACGEDSNDPGLKLGKMYLLLEAYADSGDNAALAHIHNNIGLVYGAMGQHVLAAEQYIKVYEMGLDVYKGTNLLATLISAVSSQFASGNYDAARNTIEILRDENKVINTPLTNTWLHFAEAGLHYRTENYDGLRDSLAKWSLYTDEVNNSTYNGLFRWYNAKLCLYLQDVDCLNTFLAEEAEASPGYQKFIRRNKDYLRLMVEIQLFLGNEAKVADEFASFADLLMNKFASYQSSGKVLGVANLHNEIIALESNLAEAREARRWIILALAALFSAILTTTIWFLRRRHNANLAVDSETGLLNKRVILETIKRVHKPSPGKTNALALFDLDNFKEVNSELGYLAGDQALQKIARALRTTTRDQDMVGRLSSEQFVVCLTNIEEESARTFFERMQSAIEESAGAEQRENSISLQSSMSIYLSTDTFADLDDVLKDMQQGLRRQVSDMSLARQ